MKTKKTMTDSWSCVPELKEACNEIDELGHHIYEIKIVSDYPNWRI